MRRRSTTESRVRECKEGGGVTGGGTDIFNEHQPIRQFTQGMKGGGPTLKEPNTQRFNERSEVQESPI